MSRIGSALAAATAAVLALGAPLPAAAAPPGPPGAVQLPIEGVVTHPDWVSKPSGESFANAYPLVAQALHISGKVLLTCKVAETGDLADCRVAREDPPDEGFGRAALSIAPEFKMRPQTVDGQPVGGAAVNIPIAFHFADSLAPSPSSPPPVVDQPTPAAVELARRIVAASGRQAALPNRVAGLIAAVDRLKGHVPANDQEAKAQGAAAELLETSLELVRPQFETARARALARSFTEAELRQILAFLQSPAGVAWTSRAAAVDDFETDETAALVQSAIAAARERYCAVRPCGPAAAPAGSVKASGPSPQTAPPPPARP